MSKDLRLQVEPSPKDRLAIRARVRDWCIISHRTLNTSGSPRKRQVLWNVSAACPGRPLHVPAIDCSSRGGSQVRSAGATNLYILLKIVSRLVMLFPHHEPG